MSDVTVKKLICDSCGAELITHSPYPAQYSLALDAINTNVNDGGGVYCVMVHPPIDGTKHFCNKKCLRNWLEKEQ